MPTCFGRPNIAAIYTEYEYIAGRYTGFTFAEIRSFSPRERNYWIEMTTYRNRQK